MSTYTPPPGPRTFEQLAEGMYPSAVPLPPSAVPSAPAPTGPHTFEQLAEAMYPPAAREARELLRPMFNAGETDDLVALVGRSAPNAAAARTESLKLLEAEFPGRAEAALAAGIAMAKATPSLAPLLKSTTLGNQPRAALAFAKLAARKARP